MARCAGAWRRRRAAGETAGGRAWQVGARPRERSVVRAEGSASAARRPWDAAREGGGEGRRGAWRKEGARRGKEGAARAHCPAPARPPRHRPGKGGLGWRDADASTHLARFSALSGSPQGLWSGLWLVGWREGGRERAAPGFACLPSTSAASFRTFGQTRRTCICGPTRRTLPVRFLPAIQEPSDSP